jgi:hypothetical protein
MCLTYPHPPRIYFIPTDKVLITRITIHVLCSACFHISHQLFILQDAPNPSSHVYGRYVCTFNYKALNEISESQNKISQLVYFTHNHLILFQTCCSHSTLKNGCGMLHNMNFICMKTSNLLNKFSSTNQFNAPDNHTSNSP